jgi:hypothetical protein
MQKAVGSDSWSAVTMVVGHFEKQRALLPSTPSRSPQNSYWLLASSKTADTAQPAQRVRQAEPPLFFFLVSFCMLHGPMFSSRSIYVEFPRVLNFGGGAILAYAPGRLSGRSLRLAQGGLFAPPEKRLRSG